MEETTKTLTPATIRENSKIQLGTDELFFIFVDKKVRGYTTTEANAKNVLEQLYTELEAEALKNKEKCKVFRENVSLSEIKISQQILGTVFNSSVIPLHNIHYEKINNLVL